MAYARSGGAIEDISQLLIGEDPTRIEHLWQMMYRQHFWHGNNIVRGTAMSGIDIALWDIAGKSTMFPAINFLEVACVIIYDFIATWEEVRWKIFTRQNLMMPSGSLNWPNGRCRWFYCF